MPDLSEINPEDRFVGLFVGKSGDGKKGAAASFPHPIKYYDFDGRVRGILGCPWVVSKGITVEPFPPRAKENIVDRVNRECDLISAEINSGRFIYKTIILGSLTGETNAMMQGALAITHATGIQTQGPGQPQSKGKFLGSLRMPGPEDYGYEAQGTYQFLSFLRSLPGINLIVTAHIVDKYGKKTDDDGNVIDPYAESTIIGEKLSLRDKISENSLIYFDNVFRFRRQLANDNTTVKHYVRFRSDIARTIYPELPNGDVDITGKDFYKYLIDKVKEFKVAAPKDAIMSVSGEALLK